MSKINVNGNAIVITSAVKLEELKTISEYSPKSLKLFGGENGKEELFAIGVTSGSGSISAFGASFGGTARDGSGHATITLVDDSIPTDEDAAKAYIEKKVGGAVRQINKIEAGLTDVLDGIRADRVAIMESITIN